MSPELLHRGGARTYGQARVSGGGGGGAGTFWSAAGVASTLDVNIAAIGERNNMPGGRGRVFASQLIAER